MSARDPVPVDALPAGEDVDKLRAHMETPHWPYVDFAARRDDADAQRRWPLLAELAQAAGGRA